ncbi:hypothetical protein N7G274_003431 [Stereocaulon virgatum]|uniref:Ankyrin n=1 Tax=Stereocaulon virgatum TaxID=373712 RepID=A0ABR4AGE2_9LECA
MEAVAAASSILTLVAGITKLAKSLNEVRDSYNNVALSITLVASSLSTIRAALEALHKWRANDRGTADHSKQFDKDLEVSLSCCAILITVIDGKLSESGYKSGIKQRIRYIWLEDTLKDYLSNLEGQVRALQLLLTIYQCKTATEQRQKLERAESRRIIENVRSETQTLRTANKDFQDAASVLSLDPSVRFDFDSVLMTTPTYMNVYGQRPLPRTSPPEPRRSSPVPLSPPKAIRTPPPIPDRALKPPRVQPRPPAQDGARKQVWNPYLGQVVDVGTTSRQDSRSLKEKPVDQAFAVNTDQVSSMPSQLDSESNDESEPESVPEDFKILSSKVAQAHSVQQQMEGVDDVLNCSIAMNNPDADLPPSSHESDPYGIGLKSASSTLTTRSEDVSEGTARDESLHEVASTVKNQENVTPVLPEHSSENPILTVEHTPYSLSLSLAKATGEAPHQTPELQNSAKVPSRDKPETQINKIPSGLGIELPTILDTPSSELIQTRTEGGQNQALKYAKTASNSGVTAGSLPINIESRLTQDGDGRKTPSAIHGLVNEIDLAFEDRSPQNPIASPRNSITGLSEIVKSSPELVTRPPVSRTIPSVPVEQEPRIFYGPKRITQKGSNRRMFFELDTSTIKQPVSNTVITSNPSPPQRGPPLPTRTTRGSSLSSLPPPTPKSAMSGADLYSVSSNRDSSTFGKSSTASSSDLPEVNTAESVRYSTGNTMATSLGEAPPLSAREQGQIELRNLQTELAAAKARGDNKSQEEVIQKSIEVIWRTQLAPPTDPSKKPKSLSPKLKPRASSIRFPSFTSSSKGEALGNAAATGDDRTLSKLLMEKVNVNSTSSDFKTPMMRAAMGGHVHCLEILKTFGADEFVVDKTGATALHYAVLSNNILAAKWFLETYPPPPTPDPAKNRSSILLRATDATKWSRSLKNLREASDTRGSKPLHIAVECDMDDMVQTLLAAGVDIEAKNTRGRTPLHQAVIDKRHDPFKTLLRSGADAAAIDASRMSALHWAAKLGQISMIEELLDKGAARWEYDSTDSGYFPIHQAAREGQFAAIEALITESEDLERRTKSGETLLHIASLYGHVHVVQYLLNRSVDVNPWAERSTCWKSEPHSKLMGSTLTPLHYTCRMGYFEIAILLLDHGALVNAPSPDGYTALMMAVEADDTNLVSLLYNRGAKINASLPGTFTTALHMAARKGNIDTVQQLCRAGADYKARAGKDSYKRTPAEEADHACSDKDKRKAVAEYFNIIKQNEWAKRSAQIMFAEQPVTYAPWGPNTQQGGYLVHQARNAPNPYQPPSPPPPPYTKAPPAWG